MELDLSSEVLTIAMRVYGALALLPILLQQTVFLTKGWASDDASTNWTRIVLVMWAIVLEVTNAASIYLWWHIHEYGRMPDQQALIGLLNAFLYALASTVSVVMFVIRQGARSRAVRHALLQLEHEQIASDAVDTERERVRDARTTVAPDDDRS